MKEADQNLERERRAILKPGKNCWAYEMAARSCLLVDAADYFAAFRLAVLGARRSVYIAAWDIKTYALIRDPEHLEEAIQLIDLFRTALGRNPDLHIYILCWNWTLFFARDRELFARWKWQGHPRLHFSLDSAHPLGGCHHQKLVVIDEALGFCGGMDITDHRWDMPGHRSVPLFRRDHKGRTYKPYHDVQMTVNGPAAAALATLFRERWLTATGERLACDQGPSDAWPNFLRTDIEQVRVAIARTLPGQIQEVAALNRDAIAAAEKYIYIENQYLSCPFIVESLRKKLLERGGPELLIVLPKRYPGLMEKVAIGRMTAHAIARLRSADHQHRLGVFYPESAPSNDSVYIIVHSKVLIVDGKFLRVGSSNLSGRSMQVDSECDLAIESLGDNSIAKAIETFFYRLLAEHNGCSIPEVRAQIEQESSLLKALAALRQMRTSRLETLEVPSHLPKVSAFMKIIVDPPSPWHALFLDSLRQICPDYAVRTRLLWAGFVVLMYLLFRSIFIR